MTAPSAESLIAPLLNATETGAVVWNRHSDGPYKLTLGDNTVTIFATSLLSSSRGYTLQVLDKNNVTVDWIGAYTTTDKNYGSLHKLYDVVDRRTRNVDGVVSDILRKLEAATGSPT